MRLLAALVMLAFVGSGTAHASDTYHLVNTTASPINDNNSVLYMVCVDPDVAKKIMVNGKYGRKIWVVPGASVSERQAAEMMPFGGFPVLVSADCLEKFVATFKALYPDQKLQIHDIITKR